MDYELTRIIVHKMPENVLTSSPLISQNESVETFYHRKMILTY